jgi:hypothetical protein
MAVPPVVSGSRYWVSGYPELVEQWDMERNGALTPAETRAGSGRKIWWRCAVADDHRWRATPNNRTNGTGCPYCANRRASMTNSLATRFPQLAAEWHPTKNGLQGPALIVCTSTRVVWWQCAPHPEHDWRASVRDRTRAQCGCPYCASRRVGSGNSLGVAHPTVGAEWHPTRNGTRTAFDVLPGSRKIVWWQCGADATHAWRATVCNRVLRASGCPFCARRVRLLDSVLEVRLPR